MLQIVTLMSTGQPLLYGLIFITGILLIRVISYLADSHVAPPDKIPHRQFSDTAKDQGAAL